MPRRPRSLTGLRFAFTRRMCNNHGNRMKVVVVSEYPCYPANAGNRIRTLNLMLPLARRHDITFLCRGGEVGENRQTEEYLRDQGITPIIVDDAPTKKKGPRFFGQLARNVFSSVPFSVAIHNSARVRQAIRDHANNHPVDVWQFEWLAYADAPPAGAARIVMAHDVTSLLWKRHYESETNPLKRWFIRRQWRRFERFEGRMFRDATRVITVSAEDAALARDL